MKKIISQFVKYPFYGGVVILIIVLLGFISMTHMKKATFPQMESKEITISVSYPGATPEEMDEGVTTLIENSIRGTSGIKEFSSRSSENSATVTITAYDGYNMDELLSDIKNDVDGISNFPAGAENPIISKGRTRDMAVFFSLASLDNLNLIQLNSEANLIEDDLLASGTISQVTIHGVPSHLELAIELNETQLKRYNLTLSDIKSAISSNNIDITGGTIRNPREQIKIIARNKSIDPEHIKNIVVSGNTNGANVTIGDIATVTLQFPEDPNRSYVNKKPAVVFMITKLENEDLEDISHYVRQYIKDYNASHDDYELTMRMDFLTRVDSQLKILINNGLLGIFLVVLMLSLLLNFRLSLWVAWGIPSAFLGMFILANLYGITINMISLFGMILIVGILVDDGVVIGENIFTHFERGKSPRRAAIDGSMEVLPSVFASVSTTIIAFLPLFFIEGQMEMMFDMAFVVVACLLVSLLEAVFVLPGHLANPRVLKENSNKSLYGRIRIFMDKFINTLKYKVYKPFIQITLNNKVISVSVVVAFLLITFGLIQGGFIKYTFFPKTPSDTFSIDLVLKPGVSEDRTRTILFSIEDKVWEVNQELLNKYHDTIPYISSIQSRMGSAFSGIERGTHAGTMRIFLNTIPDSKVDDNLLKKAIAKKVGTIPEAYKFAVGASNHFGAPVSISLLGYDNDELEAAKNELEAELNKMPALFNITDNSQTGSQELRLTLKPKGVALGLSISSLMSEVRSAFYGGLAQRIQNGKDEIWVYVRYDGTNRKNIGQLENMTIHTSKGDYPLGTVANIKTARSLSTINHYNSKREIRVNAYQKDQTKSVPDILNFINESIMPNILKNHPGITYMHQGQQKDTNEQMSSLILYYGIAFLIMILIIMICFKSYSQGLLIILMIPFGIIGAILGHAIHGESLSMMSLWGMVALSGVVINDAIVFMSKYNQNLVSGMKVKDAVIDAGMTRFRAIILTTVTTVAGLMPLILENNPDAAMLIPMSISLAYGILFGTFFILAFLPVLVMINNAVIYHKLKFLNRNHPEIEITRESIEPANKYAKIDQELAKNMEKKFN